MKLLSGHLSSDTAYVVTVTEHPLSRIRYWLKTDLRHGARLVTQRTNDKWPSVWLRPRITRYARYGAAMLLDAEGYVQWTGLHAYMTGAVAVAWHAAYGAGCPPDIVPAMEAWIAQQAAGQRPTDLSNDSLAVALASGVDPQADCAI